MFTLWQNEAILALNAMHDPSLTSLPHVTRLWEDGEITSEKGDGLFNQRTLHISRMGMPFSPLKPFNRASNRRDPALRTLPMRHKTAESETSFIICTPENALRGRSILYALAHRILTTLEGM